MSCVTFGRVFLRVREGVGLVTRSSGLALNSWAVGGLLAERGLGRLDIWISRCIMRFGCGKPLIVDAYSPVWTLREHVRPTVLIVARKRLRVG